METGLQRVREAIPMKRHGLPADIANASLFLVSEASGWATGAPFIIDGGAIALRS